EFRWSPRIRRQDGLVRLVPGMGTRAVDRVGDDYPALLAPGQPGLSVNVGVDEIVRYSPKKIDVINLQTNSFETLDIEAFLKEVGEEIPGLNDIVSILHEDGVIRPVGLTTDLSDETSVVTFEGLFRRTPFIKQIQTILRTLEQEIGIPVDIEFGSDGHNLFLLQCRPQSSSDQSAPVPIPRDVPKDRIVFSANRFVSNGNVPDITHIVYVVGSEYEKLASRSEMVSVGRAVGKLNKLLPKRKFILMGPGRWGSRGDIKLGVNVTYSDINNTAVLIEVARKKGDYVPDLSFGTHFFQDLVEANIRYLPLYPDDTGIVFDEQFLDRSHNILADILPEFAWLSDTVRVIDVPGSIDGMV
ncbi:MAG: pyruvate, phosphate dikinase, partial [candidate division Zixibacteria bacterium]|nr:pyruvate, phosphate dikinase [candidate division Zixibacteria bacterium]